MKKLALFALALSCASAVKHPAITAGVLGGVVGFGTCEIEEAGHGTCAAIGGGAALFLGGIAAIVMLIAPSEEPITEGEVVEEPPMRTFHHPDAGVQDSSPDAALQVDFRDAGADTAESEQR
jgi:hypothetical protein